jgi:hypothetical protein
MINHRMTEDREVELWREQWSGVAPLSPLLARQSPGRGSIVGMLVLAYYNSATTRIGSKKARQPACVFCCSSLLHAGMAYAGNMARGDTVDSCFRGTLAAKSALESGGLQIGTYIAIGWLVFCTALAAANWSTLRLELIGHLTVYLAMMLVIVLMLRVTWLGVMWFRRLKLRN